MFIIRSWTTTQ